MSILTEFIIPADEFVLVSTLMQVPDMHIEIQRVVAGEDHVTPYFWASGGDFTAFEQAIRDDPEILEVLTLKGHNTEERFYRVTWQSDPPNLLSALSESKGVILEAVSDEGKLWNVKVLFPMQDALSRFHEFCVEQDITFEVDRVYTSENPQEEAEYGVTEEQQEALVAAYHAGLFHVPRDKSLTELADDLGISRTALSARLRRGQHNLLSHTLIHDETDDE